jgi:hypothetical protein
MTRCNECSTPKTCAHIERTASHQGFCAVGIRFSCTTLFAAQLERLARETVEDLLNVSREIRVHKVNPEWVALNADKLDAIAARLSDNSYTGRFGVHHGQAAFSVVSEGRAHMEKFFKP